MQTTDVRANNLEPIERGNRLRQEGKLEEAIASFHQAISSNIKTDEAYHFLGETLAQQNKLDEAAQAYTQAIKINSNYFWSYHCLGQVLCWQGKLEEAVAASRKAIGLEDNQAPFYVQLGLALDRQEKIDEAINCYRQAIALDPNSWSAYHYFAEALSKQESVSEAIDNYLQAIKLNPSHSWSYQGLGNLYSKQRKWSEAAETYLQAIKFNPDFSWSYVYLVNSYTYLEDWQQARKYLNQGLAKYPNHPHLITYRNIVDSNLQNLQESLDDADLLHNQAIDFFSSIDTEDPQAAKKEFERGEICSNQNDWQQAEYFYNRAIRLNPYDHWYRCNLGTVLFQQGKLKQAAQIYRSAIKLKPNNSWLYKCLAETLYHQQKWQETANTYYQALKISPDDFWYCDNLGNTLFELQKWGEAEIAYRKSISIHPHDAQLQIRLGQTLLMQQKWSEAEIASNRAISLLPESVELYQNLSAALLEQGKAKESAAILEKKALYEKIIVLRGQINLEPRNHHHHQALAETLTKLEKYPEAAAAYRQGIELEKDRTWWLQGSLGDCLVKTGKYAEAETAYRQSFEIDRHKSLWLYSGLAKALYKQGKWSQVIKTCREAVELNLEAPEIYKYLGEALIRSQHWSEASQVYSRALEIYSDRKWYCAQFALGLGKALSKQERWSDAVAAYNHSLKLKPDDFKNYNDLGDALLYSRRLSEAKIAYKEALSQFPHLSWSHYLHRLSWFYYSRGTELSEKYQWDKAEQAYRHAIELEPNCPWFYPRLAQVLAQQQRYSEATEIYQRNSNPLRASWWQQQFLDNAFTQMKGLGLVVCIYSCQYNQDKQQGIRDTWLKEIIKHQIPYFFVIGKPSSQTYLEGDILYVDAPDTYEHLPQKTYKLFKFVHNQTFYSHALKVDDDCYLNVDALLRSGFENQDYSGKVLGSAGELARDWHIGKTSDPNYGEYQGEYKGTWADGASGYILNRYAMKKLLEHSHPQDVGFELYEDKLVGDILREAKIKPVHPQKYLVGVEKCDRKVYPAGSRTTNRLAFEALNETCYPHKSNNVVVFHSDAAPDVLTKIQQNYHDDEFQNRSFLRNFYWFDSQHRDHICLERIDNQEIRTTVDDVLCFMVERNESLRLPYLLSYYRSQGINKFFIVDNNSTDGTLDLLLDQPDVYLWHTSRSYAASKWGVDWIEILLQNYGVNRWCLLVDADEILYYPDCETKNIKQLCQELEQDNKEALSTVLLDMYSRQPLKQAQYNSGENFLDVCSYFDSQFYTTKALKGGPEKNVTAYFGGLRGRMFGDEQNSFCINKTPLVKYNYSVRLYEGFHWIGNVKIAEQTGCLLHFKYFSTFHEYAKREAARGEHWNGGSEYLKYFRKLEENPNLSFHLPDLSVKLESSQQLLDFGVIKRTK